MQRDLREVMLTGEEDIGIVSIVAQANIVSGFMTFNLLTFQQQRLAFGMRQSNFNARNFSDHGLLFKRRSLLVKITGDAIFKVFGLADINNLTLLI
jgi:hypothetical protein